MTNKKRIFSLRRLVFAVFATAMISTVTLSRYMSNIANGGNAQVAKFHVEMVQSSETVKEINFNGSTHEAASESQEYQFTVTGDSDVAVDYIITVTLANPLDPNITMTVDGKSHTKQEGNVYTFSDHYAIAAGDTAAKLHTLRFTAVYRQGENDTSITQVATAVTISVTATQKIF